MEKSLAERLGIEPIKIWSNDDSGEPIWWIRCYGITKKQTRCERREAHIALKDPATNPEPKFYCKSHSHQKNWNHEWLKI